MGGSDAATTLTRAKTEKDFGGSLNTGTSSAQDFQPLFSRHSEDRELPGNGLLRKVSILSPPQIPNRTLTGAQSLRGTSESRLSFSGNPRHLEGKTAQLIPVTVRAKKADHVTNLRTSLAASEVPHWYRFPDHANQSAGLLPAPPASVFYWLAPLSLTFLVSDLNSASNQSIYAS